MKKILVADDRLAGRELIRAVLEGCGYEVIDVADGRQAVEASFREMPDLLILDLQMPVLDGAGALRELRAHELFASVPILALTANAMHGDRDRALAAGFSGYVSKPVNLKFLRDEVARWLKS
jgi:two-component system cell cycle response regulator DivK